MVYSFEKILKKGLDFFRKTDIMISFEKKLRNGVMVAQQTLTLLVGVRIPFP